MIGRDRRERERESHAAPGNLTLRPDFVTYSRSAKTVLWWELTVPSEEQIAESHEYKLDRYNLPGAEIQAKGWCRYNFTIEVGIREMVAQNM